jgi:hypothetical protein
MGDVAAAPKKRARSKVDADFDVVLGDARRDAARLNLAGCVAGLAEQEGLELSDEAALALQDLGAGFARALLRCCCEAMACHRSKARTITLPRARLALRCALGDDRFCAAVARYADGRMDRARPATPKCGGSSSSSSPPSA